MEYIIIIPSSDKSKKKVGKNNNTKLSSSQCEKLACEKKVRQDAGVVVEKKKDEVSNTATYLFGEEYEIISNTIILIESIFVNDICNAQKKDLIIYELDNEGNIMVPTYPNQHHTRTITTTNHLAMIRTILCTYQKFNQQCYLAFKPTLINGQHLIYSIQSHKIIQSWHVG